MKIYLFAILATVLIFWSSSCGKEDSTPPPPTKEELVSQKPWIISSVKMNPGITYQSFTITDAGMFIEGCVRDNSYQFNSNSTITVNEGATKCDESSEQEMQQGSWKFNEDQSKMIFSDNEFLSSLTMDELTEDKLVLSRIEYLSDTTFTLPNDTEVSIPGGDQKLSLTFTH